MVMISKCHLCVEAARMLGERSRGADQHQPPI